MTTTRPATEPEPSAAAAGHDDFVALYRSEHAGQVRRAALMLGDAEAARDVVQDAFVKVLRGWDDLDDPAPYLSRVVLNGCRDHARRRATATRKMPLLVPDPSPADEPLWDALQKLPFNHRAVLVLRFYLQVSDREIAELLGCRPGSIGPWAQRGLRALRKALATESSGATEPSGDASRATSAPRLLAPRGRRPSPTFDPRRS